MNDYYDTQRHLERHYSETTQKNHARSREFKTSRSRVRVRGDRFDAAGGTRALGFQEGQRGTARAEPPPNAASAGAAALVVPELPRARALFGAWAIGSRAAHCLLLQEQELIHHYFIAPRATIDPSLLRDAEYPRGG